MQSQEKRRLRAVLFTVCAMCFTIVAFLRSGETVSQFSAATSWTCAVLWWIIASLGWRKAFKGG